MVSKTSLFTVGVTSPSVRILSALCFHGLFCSKNVKISFISVFSVIRQKDIPHLLHWPWISCSGSFYKLWSQTILIQTYDADIKRAKWTSEGWKRDSRLLLQKGKKTGLSTAQEILFAANLYSMGHESHLCRWRTRTHVKVTRARWEGNRPCSHWWTTEAVAEGWH